MCWRVRRPKTPLHPRSLSSSAVTGRRCTALYQGVTAFPYPFESERDNLQPRLWRSARRSCSTPTVSSFSSITDIPHPLPSRRQGLGACASACRSWAILELLRVSPVQSCRNGTGWYKKARLGLHKIRGGWFLFKRFLDRAELAQNRCATAAPRGHRSRTRMVDNLYCRARPDRNPRMIAVRLHFRLAPSWCWPAP